MRLPEPALGTDHPANLLREAWAALEALQASPGCDARRGFVLRFLMCGFRRYDDEAAAGLELDQALGLRPAPGQDGWWTVEARATRNQILRSIRTQHYPGLTDTAAARAMLAEIAKRARQAGGARDELAAELARAEMHAPIPRSERGLRDILAEIK